MSVNSFPLSWPEHIPRSKGRESGLFKSTLPKALENVRKSLEAFGTSSGKPVSNIIISSNYTLGEHNPADPGVAVWFNWEDMQVCIPVDRYSKIEANLQAIHHVLEARRTELRHGTLALVRATFQGFKALPPPESWKAVLGFKETDNPGEEQIVAAFRKRATAAHPDTGGSQDAMARLNMARDRAIASL